MGLLLRGQRACTTWGCAWRRADAREGDSGWASLGRCLQVVGRSVDQGGQSEGSTEQIRHRLEIRSELGGAEKLAIGRSTSYIDSKIRSVIHEWPPIAGCGRSARTPLLITGHVAYTFAH